MLPAHLPPFEPLAWLPEEWASWAKSAAEAGFRGQQIFEWLHRQGVYQPAGMRNLPALLRERLEALWAEQGGSILQREDLSAAHPSADGTVKLLLKLSDDAQVESVWLPPLRGEDEGFGSEEARGPKAQVTQCLSTQVGCAIGCVFCASGQEGWKRHLAASEILLQALAPGLLPSPLALADRFVLMGMGEPLHNYEATARFLRVLSHPRGRALPLRRVILSTSGLVPQIDRLASDFRGEVGLAISLHAADDDLRSRLVPINARYPLAELMAAVRRYPLAARRKITFEYTLMRGINDRPQDAKALSRWVEGLPALINLIPMNPVAGSEFQAPERERVESFQKLLRARGLLAFVRKRRGDEVTAACGQLALQGKYERKKGALPLFPSASARGLS